MTAPINTFYCTLSSDRGGDNKNRQDPDENSSGSDLNAKSRRVRGDLDAKTAYSPGLSKNGLYVLRNRYSAFPTSSLVLARTFSHDEILLPTAVLLTT